MSSLLALISGNGDPFYGLTQTTTSVNEGSSVVFTVSTVNVAPSTTLYWTINAISGTINSSDIQGGSTSGSFTTNSNGVGTISITMASDYTLEGSESFQLQVRTGSTSGTIVATSSTVTIADTSSAPTYLVSPSTTTVNEGSSVTFTISTNGVANGTTLYYTLNPVSGIVNTSDFSSGSFSGSVVISGASGTYNTGGSATVSYTLANDLALEGQESFQLQVRTGSITGTIVATSSTVTINDTSVPTYSVSPSTTTVNEGSSVTFTVTTAGVANNTTLFYTLNGTGISSSDFTSGSTSGSFTINSNSGSVTLTLANDLTTEGNDQFQFNVRTGSATGTIVATSSTVTIIDTSGTPTYSVSPSTTTVNEGSSVTFTVTTTGVANGTTLYYTLNGTGISSSDFTSGSTSGSFTINSNSASISLTLANDLTTEGNEQFQFNVRTGSATGTIVASSVAITIRDTSSTGTATYLVVGGGGGGGQSSPAYINTSGGGGGAGGHLTGPFEYTLGSPYPVVVGGGGVGGNPNIGMQGYQGGSSRFGPIIALGGGGGGGGAGGGRGASGGGSGGGYDTLFPYPSSGKYIPAGIGEQGNPGGRSLTYGDTPTTGSPQDPESPQYFAYIVKEYSHGGGGGGSAGVGAEAGTSNAGPGGEGIYSSLAGYTLAGGGGGGAGALGSPPSTHSSYTGPRGGWNVYNSLSAGFGRGGGGNGGRAQSSGDATLAVSAPGSNALANYGSGGGGGAVWGISPMNAAGSGGNGGSGIVIITFPSSHTITVGSGADYSTPNPTTVKFTSGFTNITFNLA